MKTNNAATSVHYNRPYSRHSMIPPDIRLAAILFASALSFVPAALRAADPAAANAADRSGSAATSSALLPAVPYTKPSWVTDLSVAVKEGYDDNIYMVSGDAMGKQYSWVTTVSPKIGFNFAPLITEEKALQVLSVGFAPDIAFYHNASSEDNTAYRFNGALKGSVGRLSYSLDNAFSFVDGSDVAFTYAPPDELRSVYATAAPRERRKQIQDRAKVVIQYDLNRWFIRPTASFLDYDLMTQLRQESGYQNYADRYDVNGGVDLGFRFLEKLAGTVGYRYGSQYQQQFPAAEDAKRLSSSSLYQRVLFGIEGNPWKWLTLSYQGGPDFRTYEPNDPDHTAPVNDLRPVYYYGEALIGLKISADDTVSFKYKQWQWVSSTGKLPYYDSLYDLTYRHRFSKAFSVDLTGRIQSANYASGNQSGSLRDDFQFTIGAGISYALSSNLSVNAAWAIDLGRNEQSNVLKPQYREFNHNLVSVSVLFRF